MGVYFLGARKYDIMSSLDGFEPDDFFCGFVTFPDPSQVLSRMSPRELKHLKKFYASECKRIVKNDTFAKFLPYSYQFAEMVPRRFRRRLICCNNLEMLVFLNNKLNFKELIKDKINQAPYRVITGKEIIQGSIENVVAQTEFGASGSGTYFLPKDISLIKNNEKYIVSDFIENRCSVSVHIQISNNQIAIYPPSLQIMKGPKWIGSDLYGFTQLDKAIQEKCLEQAQDFGKILQGLGVRGFMGLDQIVGKDGQVYAVETNARFTGTTGLLNTLSKIAGLGSVYQHTFDAFYNDSTDFDFSKISSAYRVHNLKIQHINVFDDRECQKKYYEKLRTKLGKSKSQPSQKIINVRYRIPTTKA